MGSVCNWYLCDDCRPSATAVGMPQDLWGALANLCLGEVCGGPSTVASAGTEIKYPSRKKSSKKASRKNKSEATNVAYDVAADDAVCALAQSESGDALASGVKEKSCDDANLTDAITSTAAIVGGA